MFRKLKDDMKIMMRGFSVVHETQPGIISLNISLSFFNALSPFINLYLSAEILNELSMYRDIRKLALLVILIVVLNLFTSWAGQALYHSLTVCNELFERKFTMRLNKKILTTDYTNVENSDTHMKRQRINDMRNMGGGGVWRLVYSMRNTLSNFFLLYSPPL